MGKTYFGQSRIATQLRSPKQAKLAKDFGGVIVGRMHVYHAESVARIVAELGIVYTIIMAIADKRYAYTRSIYIITRFFFNPLPQWMVQTSPVTCGHL